MIGVELLPWGDLTAAALADEVLERMKDAGYLLGKTGPQRNILTWMPPSIVTEEQLQGAVDELARILGSFQAAGKQGS
jgi:4-aminobutyrate aminotransferase-like enzyme